MFKKTKKTIAYNQEKGILFEKVISTYNHYSSGKSCSSEIFADNYDKVPAVLSTNDSYGHYTYIYYFLSCVWLPLQSDQHRFTRRHVATDICHDPRKMALTTPCSCSTGE